MKTIDYINKFIYILTAGLYASVSLAFFGLYSQILLGGVQLLLGLILLIKLNRFNKHIKIQLIVYWLLALSNLYIVNIITNSNTSFFNKYHILFMFIIPMCTATYFTYITHQISNLSWNK